MFLTQIQILWRREY